MHGKGVLIWNDGKRYDGEFKNDKRQGKGVFTWKDGRVYDGEWADGKQHGRGIFIKQDGTKKVGIWENGRNIRWLDETPTEGAPTKETPNPMQNMAA